MLIFALLILALPTSSGPRSVKYALLDARDVKAAAAAKGCQLGARKVSTALPAHLTLADTPAVEAFLTPATNVPQTLTLTAPETLRLFWIQSGNGAANIPALYRDHEYYRISSSKGQVMGLWDVTSGIHADIRLGDVVFEHEQASLRIIPIHTTSTKMPGGVQPGFVLGFGTTW